MYLLVLTTETFIKMDYSKEIIRTERMHKHDVYNLDGFTWWFDTKTFIHSTWRYRYKVINRFTVCDVSIATIGNIIFFYI